MNEAIITLPMSLSQTDVNIPGYVLYGFEEIAQWHAESNSSISVMMIMIMVKMILMMVTMVLMISIMMMMALITMVAEYEYFDTLYDVNYGAKKKRTIINEYDDSGEYEEVEVERFDLLCVCTIQVQK